MGTFPAVLHVASANNGVPPVDVPLTGLGIAGDLSLTSLELDFKTVAIGATGGPLTVTLRNPGATPITLAGITSDAIDFVVVASPQLTATLQPGESMTFSVTFKPSSVGPQRASIAIDTAVRKGAAVVVAIGAGQASVAGGGCNCAIAPSSPDALGSLALGLLALLLSRRRRRT
ncbi:MAG: choice-of-anchor D domain-containing protein [Myxococcales bacterium]|nr:choice-of-anchor D domain-containing protein [Myxococcales bacterium]